MNPLWKCGACRKVGTEAQAERHTRDTGHTTEKIPEHRAKRIREIWRKQGRRPADGARM